MSNITDFPKQPDPPRFLIGPFEYHAVIVDGRVIPRLTGRPMPDGRVTLVLDHRWAADFSEPDARQAAFLIANALALGAGYTHMGADQPGGPFAPRAGFVDVIPGEDPGV